MKQIQSSDTERLEHLWRGDFGNAYIQRNSDAARNRYGFWRSLLGEVQVERVLEVGCNIGGNLTWLAQLLPPSSVYGVDVNETALAQVRRELPNVNAVRSPARELPFRDAFFDLTFTMCVLIHQSPESLPLAMAEVVRCSRRYVLCGEYFAEELEEVPYRGQSGALYKRDYGKLYSNLFPNLQLLRQGFVGKSEGFDDVTWWLFEKK